MTRDTIWEAKGYVFDMDGTLLTLPVDWTAARARLAELSGKSDFPRTFETISEVVKQRPDLRQPLLGALDDFELRVEAQARLYEGSKEVLELLARRAKLALVTMQGKKVRDLILSRFELEGLFQVEISREDSFERREQLVMAASGLGLHLRQLVFFGDRLHDLNSAADVGMGFVLMGERAGITARSFSNMNALLANLRRFGS